jgi:hypothetical protein
MHRGLKERIYSNMENYKKPDTIELTPTQLRALSSLKKKPAPKKKLTLNEKKLQKAIAILLRK